MSTTPLLHLQHLQKNFGHFRALKDVTFDVYPGEVFGFIGPNGLVNPRRFASYLGSFGPVVVPPLSSVGPSGRIVFRFISDWLTFPAMSISGLT